MLKVITPPLLEPVTLAEAKKHLRLEITDDDELVTEQLTAARELSELWIARSFLSTAWRLTLDHFPWYLYANQTLDPAGSQPYSWLERPIPGTLLPILLPRADLIAVTSISYVDAQGVTQVLAPELYQVEAGAPGRIVPAYGKAWPTARTQPAGVTIDFTAGYGPSADDVPKILKAAIKLLLGHLYENREATMEITLEETPFAYRQLLAMADWGYRP